MTQFKYSRAVDFVCAFFIWSSWERLEKISSAKQAFSELRRWKVETDAKLPSLVKEQGKSLVDEFLLLFFSLIKIVHLEKIESCPGLIERLSRIEGEELCRYIILGEGFSFSAAELLADPLQGGKCLDTYSGTVRPEEKEHFINFLTYPEFLIRQLHSVLDLFYQEAFASREKRIEEKMLKVLENDKKQFESAPQEFIKDRFYYDSESGKMPETAYLSWFYFADIAIADDPFIVVYGWLNSDKEKEVSPEEIYQLLTDETRRSILRELGKKAMYSREIAIKWNLSPSTVSYHMSKLFELGLVKHRIGERKRIYHYLDKERLSRLLEIVRFDLNA